MKRTKGYLKDPEYIKAKEARRIFRPQKGVDYKWVYNHAKDQIEEANQVRVNLNKKADNLIKYAGAGMTTLAVIYPLLSQSENTTAYWNLFIALLIGLGALGCAFFAVFPRYGLGTMSIPDIIKTIDHYQSEQTSNRPYTDNDVVGLIATTSSVVVANLEYLNVKQSKLIKTSYALFLIAISWVVITFSLINIL